MTKLDQKQKRLPRFTLARCKQCGICGHFCPKGVIAFDDHGMPFLTDADACTSCGLCEDMCPDWAVCLTLPEAVEPGEGTA